MTDLTAPAAAKPEVISCPCEKCAGDTDHDVLHTHEDRGEEGHDDDRIWWIDEYKTIRCRGCRIVGLRHAYYFSEDISYPDYEPSWVKYIPPRLTRRLPSWIEHVDQELQDLLKEVYSALRQRSIRLVAMGVRALVEAVARHKLGGDQGTFEDHLDALEEEGIIGARQRSILEVVIDAGSATIHRGYTPPEGLVDPMLDTVEAILNHTYVSGPMLDAAKLTIPPRPPRAKRKNKKEGAVTGQTVPEVPPPPRGIAG